MRFLPSPSASDRTEGNTEEVLVVELKPLLR